MDAPERIWVEEPEVFDGMGFWQETQSADLRPYTRADLLTAAIARAEAVQSDLESVTTARDMMGRLWTQEKERAEAAEAAAKTAREDALREAAGVAELTLGMATDLPTPQIRDVLTSILALIEKEPK